jgi:anti-sigma factor ChrR (cupin superfamily)
MIFGRAWFAIAAMAAAPSAQVAQETIDLGKEPHHTILVQNSRTRVYRLRLAPGESTLRHEHTGFYAFVSLYDTTIQNEVLGRNPVVSQLAAGELHTSKGGFRLIEHNVSTEPACEFIVVEFD